MHFVKLSFYRDIGFPEKISAYSSRDDQKPREASQESSPNPYAPRPSGNYGLVYSMLIWTSGAANASLGMCLIVFCMCGHRRVLGIVGLMLIILGGAMGWTGAAVLMWPKTPIASSSHLASANRRSENISIFSVVIPELKLGDIERHVLAANFVEAADDAALDDRPKAFDCLSMDRANNILLFGVVDDGVWIFFAKMLVTDPLIRAEQRDFVRDGFVHEGFERSGADVFDNAGYDVSLTLHGTNNRSFTGTNAASPTAIAALILVPILRQAADEGFVNLNYAAKLLNILDQGDTDFVAHHPRGFVRTETHEPHNLQCAHTLLAGQHQVDDTIPVTERFVGVLKDRPGEMGKAIAHRTSRSAFRALPVPFARRQIVDSGIAASRAAHAFGPAAGDKVGFASFLIWEHSLELGGGKLGNGLGLFSVGHDGSPSTMEGYCHA
jgi:hypothetical protein